MRKRLILLLLAILMIGMMASEVFAAEMDDLVGKTVYVSNRWIKIYTKTSTFSTSKQIPYMTEVYLSALTRKSSTGGWYELEYEGSTWYVWVAAGDTVFTAEESEYYYTSDNPYRQAVLDLASEINLEWPTRYKLGEDEGRLDQDGYHLFDCSGFVSYVLDTTLRQWNPLYNAPHGAQEMYDVEILYNEGLRGEFRPEEVSLSEAQPGDVLFFNMSSSEGKIDHCGLYVGNNEFLHSTDSGPVRGVSLTTMKGYMDNLVAVKRYIPDKIVPANATMAAVNNYTKLRSTNTSDYETIKVFKKGEEVKLKFTNRFSYIYVESSDGLEGYVLANSLELMETEEPGVRGDVDGSGSVDYFDAMLIMQHFAGITGESELDTGAADVDGSGVIDFFDAMYVLQYFAGSIDEFPV